MRSAAHMDLPGDRGHDDDVHGTGRLAQAAAGADGGVYFGDEVAVHPDGAGERAGPNAVAITDTGKLTGLIPTGDDLGGGTVLEPIVDELLSGLLLPSLAEDDRDHLLFNRDLHLRTHDGRHHPGGFRTPDGTAVQRGPALHHGCRERDTPRKTAGPALGMGKHVIHF